MKKLLQINSVINSGSTGRIVEEIGKTAIRAGWDSYIAYGRNERPSDSKTIKIGNACDIRIHGLQTRLFDKHGLGSKESTNNLLIQIETIKPDIIHLHNIHGYYINYEILFRYLNKTSVPVVWTLHDCWSITGHCSHFTFVDCQKWKNKCYSCPQVNEYPASLLIDRSEKNFKLKKELFTSLSNLTLVPVSSWLGDIIEKSFMKNYPVKIINNGINIEVFKPVNRQTIESKFPLEEKIILLGVASIWSNKKGFSDFIELSRILDEDRYQIVLIGLTKKQIKQLPKHIIGIERTESIQELAELYSISDIYLNPTYEDTFPTTNLEALACGTPVITYNTGGSPEALDDSTGIVINKGDINGLIKAINEIESKGKEFYSTACVNRANRLYRKNDRFNEYIELYEKLL